MNDNKTYTNSIKVAVFKLAILLVILIGIPIYVYINHHDVISSFTSVAELKNALIENKGTGSLIYIGFQILQQIFCVIPGQPFQFAAGYVYGPFWALFLSLIGVITGTTITFFMARFLGHDFMYLVFGQRKVVEWIEKFNTKKGYFVLFLIYFIPGFPKDMVGYVAGLSTLKWLPFIIISTVARTLPMFCSILVGSFTGSEKFELAIVVAAVVVIITILCVKNKDKILAWGDRVYDKLSNL